MDHMPVVGTTVIVGKAEYTVVRPGCATDMEECPNGDSAVTIVRVGKSRGASLCTSFERLSEVPD